MKKHCLWVVLLIITAGFLHAQDTQDTQEVSKSPEESSATSFRWPSFMTTENASISSGIQRRRAFELSLLSVGLETSSSLFNTKDFFALVSGSFNSDTLFSIEEILKKDEITVNAGLHAQIFTVRFRVFNLFALDFGLNSESTMQVLMPESTMTSLRTLHDFSKHPGMDFPDLSGSLVTAGYSFAAFTAGIEKTFLRDKLLIRAAPQVFTPLLYIPKQKIHLKSEQDDKYYELKSEGQTDITVWSTPAGNIGGELGVDMTLEGRYAIWPVLDAGLSIENIPLVPATMRHSTNYAFDVNFQIPKQISGAQDIEDMKTDFDFSTTEDGTSSSYSVNRPFRFDVYAIIKPFKSSFLLIRPDVGFSLLVPQSDGALVNWGIQAQLNLPVILSLTAGTRLFEEIWVQYLNMGLNLVLFEVNLGVSLHGSTFVNSWTSSGLGFRLAIKTGI